MAELLEVLVKEVLGALDEVKDPGSHSPLISPLWAAVIPWIILGPGQLAGVLRILGCGGPLVTRGGIQVRVCLGWRLQNILVWQEGTLDWGVRGRHLGSCLPLLHHVIRSG
jgi:hypothetical protein